MKYYYSLTDAVADVGALADVAGAKVAADTDVAGVRHVVLLDDVTENGQVNVAHSMVLVLGGKVLTLTGGALKFEAGTVCTIDGTAPGSRILRSGNGGSAEAVVASGEKLTIMGGNYDAVGNFPDNVTAVKVTVGKLVMEDVSVSAENTCLNYHYAHARAVQCNPGTEAEILGGQLKAEGQDRANGLMIGGEAKVENVELEAISLSTGEMYVPAATVMILGTAEMEMKNCSIHCSTQAIDGYGVFNNGANLKLENCAVAVESQTSFIWGVSNESGNMQMVDCTIMANSQSGMVWGVGTAGSICMERCKVNSESVQGNSTGIENYAGNWLNMDMCKVISHTSSTEAGCAGVRNNGTGVIVNSVVFADSAHGKKAIGVDNGGVCYLVNTDVTGCHSGCQNGGHLYVQGGIFTGWTHGGLYFASGDRPGVEGGESGEKYLNYICDAYTRCGYLGQHADEIKSTAASFGACAYVGSGSEITVYMDNCVIGGAPAVNFDLLQYRADVEEQLAVDPDCGLRVPQIVPHAIAFRHALGERDNVLKISNSTVLEDTGKIRIDNADDGSDLGHRLYVGCGTNITLDTVNNNADTIFTPERCYRRNMAGFKAQVNG